MAATAPDEAERKADGLYNGSPSVTSLQREISLERKASEYKQISEAKVLVVFTGGTIGMKYIKNIGTIVGRSITIPPGYKENLKKAIYTFKHQTVYHPDKGYVPLNDYPPGVSAVDLDYAGLPLPDAPVVDLSRTWISVQMLDKTDLTDVTFHGSETSDAGSSQSSSGPHYTLRSTQAQECTVMAVGEGLKWTPPCFPVMTLTFLKASVSMDGDLKSSLFKASDHRLLLSPPPFNIAVKKSCSITVDNVEYFVVWSWDHLALCDTISEDTLSQGTRSTFSSVQTVSESDYVSESDSDNDVVEEESDSDKDSVEPHELAFKVMGVTYKHRYQEVLEEAFMAIKDDNRTPPADIVAEPDNPHDQNAIAVRIYTKNGAEKVGYIQREVTPYVHNVINSNTLAGVRIGHIAFRVTWYHPGWYMKLMITKLGKWEMPVILKSYRVK